MAVMIRIVIFFAASGFCSRSPVVSGLNLLPWFSFDKNIHADPDVYLQTLELIRKNGYPAEAHVVETEDGYLLTVHRIPQDNAPTVLLQHGLLGSSADWVFSGKEKALAYILSDAGYDVWLGNVRGNTYSRSHVNLTISDPQYWNFSWHEMGVYDLPAVIRYIAERKKDNKLFYIGHSMGTTMFYVMASERPEITKGIQVMLSLAPVAFMTHVRSPIRLIAPFAKDIEIVTELLGANEFLPQNTFLRVLAKYVCDKVNWEKELCANIFFIFSGFDQAEFNDTLIPVILGHSPAGTSTRTVVHYAQEIQSGEFRQFDYGSSTNKRVYNNTTPPSYDLTKINVPVAIYYADNDWLASVNDVLRFYTKLPIKAGKYRVPYPKFSHLDFLWAIDAPSMIYTRVLSMLQQYKISVDPVYLQNLD
ncbi:lipase 3 isoform X2 [Orussus abietinus]|uniref:lipase 3 isoform X2 n=1 Tax=Orussus abietinus TaxID=222816 RepID=UPI0006267504|nr:lipase 3 isoform X2 [Orussus abietinus]